MGPDMSGMPNKPGLVGSVRTRLQHFSVRDRDRQEGRQDLTDLVRSFSTLAISVRQHAERLCNGTAVARFNPDPAAQAWKSCLDHHGIVGLPITFGCRMDVADGFFLAAAAQSYEVAHGSLSQS